MSWEAVTAIATLITAIVIAATAITAIVQIRHLRTANQLSAALSLYREFDSAEYRKARSFVQIELEQRMQDPVFREQLASDKFDRDVHLEMKVGDYWQNFGLLLRTGLLDRTLSLDFATPICLRDWRLLLGVTRILRVRRPDVWGDFEYLARLSSEYVRSSDRHPLRQPKWGEGFEDLDLDAAPAGR